MTEIVNMTTASGAEENLSQESKNTGKRRNEETIKRQILTNVRKHLAEEASKRAKDGEEYQAPTKEEIAAECKRRWQKHLERYQEKEDVSSYFD